MIFFGGLLQILGAIGEWILGNTFPMCLFFTYGTFWIVAGTQLIPWFGVGVQYSATGDSFQGMTEPSYFATVGTSFPRSLPRPQINLPAFAQDSTRTQLRVTTDVKCHRILLPLLGNDNDDLHDLLLAHQPRLLLGAFHADLRLQLCVGSLL